MKTSPDIQSLKSEGRAPMVWKKKHLLKSSLARFTVTSKNILQIQITFSLLVSPFTNQLHQIKIFIFLSTFASGLNNPNLAIWLVPGAHSLSQTSPGGIIVMALFTSLFVVCEWAKAVMYECMNVQLPWTMTKYWFFLAYLGNCKKQFSCKVKHHYVTETMKKKIINDINLSTIECVHTWNSRSMKNLGNLICYSCTINYT